MRRWASLAPDRALAAAIPGGPVALDHWLAAQRARVTDPAFAALFDSAAAATGQPRDAFLHRHLCSRYGPVLGGIRFFGGDPARPFVEILAHDMDDPDALARVVAAEWAAFAPAEMRLRLAPGSGPGRPDCALWYGLAEALRSPGAPVDLRPVGADVAAPLVAAAYAAQHDRALARRIAPADRETLADVAACGGLHGIHDPDLAGILAIAPGAVDWVPGHRVEELAVAPAARGRRLAARAQATWARDRTGPLIGTIDALNGASAASAARSGRRAVLQWRFVGLGP